MSHLRSPRAMIWPTLRAIEFPPWPAREAHNWRTHAVSKERIFRLIEQRMADRPSLVHSPYGQSVGSSCRDLSRVGRKVVGSNDRLRCIRDGEGALRRPRQGYCIVT